MTELESRIIARVAWLADSLAIGNDGEPRDPVPGEVQDLRDLCRMAQRIKLTTEEREALEAVNAAFEKITKLQGGLNVNKGELVQAIHVMQSFIQQSVLQRIDPSSWGRWFGQ